jgi:AraC-like DNA-binding protein/ligand-binding sensor protein
MAEAKYQSDLLVKLSEFAQNFAGIQFLVVYPNDEGWGQDFPGNLQERPEFCRLIQSVEEGAKHCKMCHVLMSIAACNDDVCEQKCHSGASVLLTPVHIEGEEGFAVLSTCIFNHNAQKEPWDTIKERGKHLGLDLKKFKKAFEALPELDDDKIEIARSIMGLVGEAVKEAKERMDLERSLAEIKSRSKSGDNVNDLVRSKLKDSLAIEPPERRKSLGNGKKKAPALIDIVIDLINRKPNMPFTVGEIAAAARMTPNHFSSLFREHHGQCFSDYLAERRIEAAKALLGDLTLNITEVAARVGYDDPGYFARRFKQKTGKTPRAWRESSAPARVSTTPSP